MSDDWTTRPFTDLIVTNKEVCPPSHPDLAIFRHWLGSGIGCRVNNLWDSDKTPSTCNKLSDMTLNAVSYSILDKAKPLHPIIMG